MPRRSSALILPLLCTVALSGCIPGSQHQHPTHSRPAPPPAAPTPIVPSQTAAPAPQPAPATLASDVKPSPPPAWVAAPVSADAVTVNAQVYRVASGDTLRSIAAKTGSSSELIARDNAITPPFIVKVGQRLKIPGGRFHLVRRGQSGIAIARAYGVEWGRIVTLNHLTEPFILREGMRLLLPSEREVASMSMEQRASAFNLDIDDILTGGEPALAETAKPAKPVATPTRTLPASAAVTEPGGNFNGRVAWPVQGKVVRRFGLIGNGLKNDGINIAAPAGTPILAAADGTVAYAGNDIAIYGGLILIRHADGWLTAYGYADQLAVKRGQAVKKGQAIAVIGNPGATMAEAQLHFELRQGRKPVNPADYLTPRS